MKRLLPVLIVCLAAGIAAADGGETDLAEINAVLDDFHAAAASADAERYLGHLDDDAVFMGTDEWERWPKHPDFEEYVAARFENGGWSYRPVERQMRVAGDTAWFDEVIFSESNGRFRGTGVLIRRGDGWKIAHYAMSFLVFNEDWQAVIELTKKTRSEKEGQ